LNIILRQQFKFKFYFLDLKNKITKNNNKMVCTKPAQFILISFNVIFLIFGACLIGVGLWTAFDPNIEEKVQFSEDILNKKENLLFFSGLVVVAGAVTTALGLIGFFGALKRNRFLLSTYFILLLVLLVIKLIAVFLIFSYTNEVKVELKKQLEIIFDNSIKNGTFDNKKFETVQKYLKCCGINDPSDYEASGINELPASCYNNGTELNQVGCYTLVSDQVNEQLPVIVGTLFAVILTEFLAILFSICICAKNKNNYEDL
jgi:hypothetical protein